MHCLLQHWESIFDKFDTNHDGKISYKELRKNLKKIDHDIPSNTVRKILKKGDTDENGYLDLNEFLAIAKENKEIRGLFSQSVEKWVTTVCVIPRRGKDMTDAEYEEQYSCCPPPLFMILISLLEVSEKKKKFYKT